MQDFKKAKWYLYGHADLTVYGEKDNLGWHEGYRDDFCNVLQSLGCVTDEDYAALLGDMNQYNDVGDFLDYTDTQKLEMASFGLILYGRLNRLKDGEISNKDFFYRMYGLFECHTFAMRGQERSAIAIKAAGVRHAEHRSMKLDVFRWLDEQVNFKSLDSAAEAVIKQQPIAFRTARDWVGEWKKVRSAGTP